MNKYFGTKSHKTSKAAYARNTTLAAIRAAIIGNRSMKLGTSDPEKWHTILRDEFPDVSLRIVDGGVLINERQT